MFIGHFAVGFAAKRVAPRASLGVLMAAAQLLDLIWPILLLAGIEHVEIEPGNTAMTPLAFVDYPISHSLFTVFGWALAAAGVYWLLTRYRAGAVVVGVAVLSHWFLDAVVHRPDLPLYPGSSVLAGLGFWNSVPGTVLVEGALFAMSLWLYVRSTKSRDWVGAVALWGFVAFLVAIYVANLIGPPPPSARAVASVGLAGYLLPLWAGWFDGHRVAKR